MAKYIVQTWYSCVEYGKCWQTVEADTPEQAKEIAFGDGEWEDYKDKGVTDFDYDWDEAEVYRLRTDDLSEETDNG